MELTSKQKHDISIELNASDIYETVPFLNKVLAAIGYVDRLDDDSEREELRWTKRKEPLIKDEKIRKAVRAWAEAVDTNSAYVEKGCYENDQFVLSNEMAEIHFRISTPEEIRFYKRYTIAELCGEED